MRRRMLGALDAAGDARRTLAMLADVLLALGESSTVTDPDTLCTLAGVAREGADALGAALAEASAQREGA